MQMRRAVKCLVALACSLAALGMASAVSHMVNYRGQPQEDLTCMQAYSSTAVLWYRNDPSTNCFGFPSLQFDTAPIEGGKPNGMTIDWSLMVDELQMQDDDRIHFHLPGFTGGHNTFGIMGPAIDTAVDTNQYKPNFDSESVAADGTGSLAIRADFGALVGIWGISCGTEKNLYMDRAKVDNLRTAEWDPAREMLKFVLKARRYGDVMGRHDGYTGSRGTIGNKDSTSSKGTANWILPASSGQAVPFSRSTTDPKYPKADATNVPVSTTTLAEDLEVTLNGESLRGSHLQAMEYSFEGPRDGAAIATQQDLTVLGVDTTTTAVATYKNDGYIYAPGNRVCGIYVDPTKLYVGQKASNIQNGKGPLPPFGGIGKNWYKLAYMRKFANTECSGGQTRADGKFSRPGMLPESCTVTIKSQDPSKFWQVPFDGDTERVVGYQFTTSQSMLPVAGKGAKPAGFLQAPTFSFAQAKGWKTGKGLDNCITVSLMPSVTFVSTGSTKITIDGLLTSETGDTDTLQLYSDDKCTSLFSNLKGSDGAATKSFQPVAGTALHGTPDALLANYRPMGRSALNSDGKTRARTLLAHGQQQLDAEDFVTTKAIFAPSATNGFGSDGYFDDVDWHTRARSGTTTALTTGISNNNIATASTLTSAYATQALSSMLASTEGNLAAGNGKAKFAKDTGRLTMKIAPGYHLKSGELLVFSFLLKNSNSVQPEQSLTVSASGTYCDSGDDFCDGVNDKSLDIKAVPVVSKGKILKAETAMFATATIYQSSSDPDDLTTIFVTLKPNLDLKKPDSAADAKITISGLDKCGFETGTNVKLYQNQKAGGLSYDNKYPTEAIISTDDLPGKESEIDSILATAATYEAGNLKIALGTTGLVAESTYAFAFQMQTSKVANAGCTPKISSTGGSETVPAQSMSGKTIGVVMAPQFTTLKIGQVTTRPGVTNYLCVTLQHNFQFYTDAVVNQGVGATGNYIESKITISGLTGTQAVSTVGTSTKGYALAYCPTEVPYFDDKTTQHTSTQFQPDVTDFTPKRYATFQSTCFGDSAANQKCVPGNPYVPATALDASVAGRSWFGGQSLDKDSFTWDQATGTAVLTVDADITKERVTEPQTVKGGIPKNSEIVFALPLQNGVAASGCKTVSFEASGRITQKATMMQTKTGKALQDGEVPGDACALKVYEPGFLVRQITQTTSTTDDENVITVSLRTNVDFSSVANGQASFITISGLTGTATANADKMQINVPSMKFSPKFQSNEGDWVQNTGTLTLKLDAGACVVPTVWASGPSGSTVAPYALGGSDAVSASIQTSTGKTSLKDEQAGYMTGGKLGTSMPSVCIKAGFVYAFTITVVNPAAEQAAPSVSIAGVYRNSDNAAVAIAPKAMQGPISDDSDKAAMFISNQILTTYKIGQLVPAPGSINVICVTLKASKEIKSQANAPLSSITLTGLTGFDASAQDLQLYENDGVTKILAAGGNPASTANVNNAYKVGAIFSSQNSASGTSAGNSNGAATSGLGFANYDGQDKGNLVLWIQGEKNPSDAYQYMQKGVEHKFCFQIKNPKTEMACKDVSVVVNNQGTIGKVKAVQDTGNAIEYYNYGSTCAGYVAPPNFVVKNWRSSSNTTSTSATAPDATAIIHLELASNILLEAGDTITVSGLTSYTQGACNFPCDVDITVSRTEVSYVNGKPYINGYRNVKGIGNTDSGAAAADRITFAKAIQSVDTSGKTDDGASSTSTFGTKATWGQLGDTVDTASTLTFTVAKEAKMKAADISNSIGTFNAPSDAAMYEIVFSLKNKAVAVSAAPTISINIGKGQTQYVKLAVNSGAGSTVNNGVKACDGGLEITFTPMKTIYGGESLVLTLPKFTRDSNGMLFGVSSAPNSAFKTYSSWQDWKAYGTDHKYARAFFTNGWYADGYSAKSGDSGQTGERWNYPNVNAKVTTDADYNHDTGVLVLDMNDPGIGQNKNYWYAATEDNLYEGRVTRAANDGAAVTYGSTPSMAADLLSTSLPDVATTATSTAPGNAGSVDYYLDNGEELKPVRAFAFLKEEKDAGTTYNNFRRPVAFLKMSSTTPDIANYVTNLNTVNVFPAPVPSTADALVDDIVGTPPFTGILSKYQPSRRDNFYKGMLMKCWVGTAAVGGRHQYVAALETGTDNYKAEASPIQELLPPPEYKPISAFGKKISGAFEDTVASNFGRQQASMTQTTIKDATVFSKAGVSRALETRVIQASFRQIDYVPRKSLGCFFTGDVKSRAVIKTATIITGAVDAAATAGTIRSFKNTLTTSTTPDFVVGQQIVSSDLIGRTVTGPATMTTSPVVDGPAMTVGAPLASSVLLGLTSSTAIAAANCQDEVPGYPAVVRLESPFSRPLDPDTLCYIQRKADVGVYTGMTAMVGNKEYLIKQGAANIYTVAHVAKEMKDVNGNPVDRKVPRSYSTEKATMPASGKRTAEFFGDGVGLSGQPYTIYSQLELVAKKGSKVMVGETITITIPSSMAISPPSDMSAFVTPATTYVEDTIAEKVKISHVLLVPLSPACSVVAAYGVASGCQEGNGKGGVFDLILSDKWPYAYTSENLNDINGYSMTVFGGQATVVKTMADKYSQDLPYKPLEGLSGIKFATSATITVTSGAFQSGGVLNPLADTRRESGLYGSLDQGPAGANTAPTVTFGRAQSGTASFKTLQSTVSMGTDATVSGSSNPNSLVDATFNVVRELDTLSLTMGSFRADSQKTPKLPNAPITVTNGACGTKVSDTLGPATLPYAVCMSLGGSLAHNQDVGPVDLVANAYITETGSGPQLMGVIGTPPAMRWGVPVEITAATTVPQAIVRPGMMVVISPEDATRVFAIVNSIDDDAAFKITCTRVWPPNGAGATGLVTPAGNKKIYVVNIGSQADKTGKLIEGVQKITGAVGQEATPVMPTMIKDLYSKMGSARPVPNYGTTMGYSENPADALGLGALIVVGVYNNGTSDRFVTGQEGNKGSGGKLGLPTSTDMANNVVLQRYLGTSRTTIPLADIPSGFVGSSLLQNGGSATFTKPAGQVPRYQVRVAGGYAIGRFSHGVDNIMHVRSDVTAGAHATGYEGTVDGIATGLHTTTSAVGYRSGVTNVAPVHDLGMVNMDGALPASPYSRPSVPFGMIGATDYTTDLLLTTVTVTTVIPQAVGSKFLTLTVSGSALATFQVGDNIMVATNAAAAGTTAAHCADSLEVLRVVVVNSNTEIVVERGNRPRPVISVTASNLCIVKNNNMNKHLSGHSVDVANPTNMQRVRFGRGTLPLPQVFHTASHQASATGYANSLTRGHCGREGAGAGAATAAVGTVLKTATLTLAQYQNAAQTSEMCTNIDNDAVETNAPVSNTGLPFSRNVYIEQGMDVYLVSSLFDSLIQRPEPIRLTAVGTTEEGRLQQGTAGSGYYAGDALANYDVIETTVAAAAIVPYSAGRHSMLVTTVTNQLAVGDIIFFAPPTTSTRSTVLAKEARKVVEITSDLAIVVERGVLGTNLLENVAGDVAFKLSVGGAFPGGQGVPAVGPQKSLRDPSGIHSGDNQVQGNIQTTGVRMPRGGPATGAIAAASANAKGISTHSLLDTANNNYGFDSDFRLYSVLGPFMRPAIIRDVIDTSKISRSVQTSRFPGVTTIHDAAPVAITASNLAVLTATITSTVKTGVLATTGALTELEVGDFIMTAATAATAAATAANCIAHGEVMEVLSIDKNANPGQITVRRGALGTIVKAPATVGLCRLVTPPREERNNNGLYSLAPIKGTTFATAQDRKTQYHTYHAETDRIISFCNPMQSDLNNAPGSVIMSAISDDPVSKYSLGQANPVEDELDNPTQKLSANKYLAAETSMVTVNEPSLFLAVGDYIMVGPAAGGKAGAITRAEIMLVTAVTASGGSKTIKVDRGQLGTTAADTVASDVIFILPRGTAAAPGKTVNGVTGTARMVVNNFATRSSLTDTKFASSNGNEATAPSMWTVPRRHHLCRKLITGAPELGAPDVAADLYVAAQVKGDNTAVYSAAYARSRYTESIQANNVLNQDPSPNMRAMVTFMEPTKIAVSTECASACEFSAAGFKPSLVNPSCATFTLRSETFSVTFPADFPHLAAVSLKETAFASYAEVDADKAAGGIAVSDRKLGVNTYNKGMFLGNFGDIGGIPETNAATFTIKQAASREATLAGIDATARRRLLATCPAGFDARMLRVGSLLKTACDCPTVCGKAESECTTAAGGTWSTINLLERVCKATPSPYDPTGAIVGGVLGGFFGLLLIGLLVWYLCCRKPAPEPVGRAVAIEKPLAPVYLPQPYPMLPEQYVPMPMPVLDATTSIVQPTGQPMLYSSFQGAPIMEAYPAQPGSYPAPYGVAPQVAYGI